MDLIGFETVKACSEWKIRRAAETGMPFLRVRDLYPSRRDAWFSSKIGPIQLTHPWEIIMSELSPDAQRTHRLLYN